MHSWVLFAWSVAGYTVGCGALSWVNQRRVGVAMKYFDACTRAVFAGHVLTLSTLIAVACWLDLDRGTPGAFPRGRRARRAPRSRVRALDGPTAPSPPAGRPMSTAPRFDEVMHAPNRPAE